MFESRGFLLDVTDRCPNRFTMQELVDILARFGYNEFYLHDAAPSREVPLDTAKTAAYCAMQGIEFRAVGAEGLRALETDADTVTAPTFAARSLCGRIEEMRVAMERAEERGRARKAGRFLVTDMSDGYAWHPLCVSLPGIILGGNLMTAGRAAAKMDLEKDLCSVTALPSAGLIQRLGTMYLRGGAVRDDASEYFNMLASCATCTATSGACASRRRAASSRSPGSPASDTERGNCGIIRIADFARKRDLSATKTNEESETQKR